MNQGSGRIGVNAANIDPDLLQGNLLNDPLNVQLIQTPGLTASGSHDGL